MGKPGRFGSTPGSRWLRGQASAENFITSCNDRSCCSWNPPSSGRVSLAPVSVAFEKLYFALVLICSLASLERAEIPPLTGLGILLPGVKAILTGFQFSDHTLLCVPLPGYITAALLRRA